MTEGPLAPGELELSVLLASMSPVLDPADYVFGSGPAYAHRGDAIMVFQEREGETRIVPALDAPDNLRYARIELRVHSSLAAVGLTAAVSAALTEVGISANVVAAYFHDHIFVPRARAEDALDALLHLSAQSRKDQG